MRVSEVLGLREEVRTKGRKEVSNSLPAQSYIHNTTHDESRNKPLSCKGTGAQSGSFPTSAADNKAEKAEEEPVSNPDSLNCTGRGKIYSAGLW